MKTINILLILLLFSFAFSQLPNNSIEFSTSPRIINGEIEPTEKIPVGVMARFDGGITCTLNILAPKVALIAGHCPEDFLASEILVGVGNLKENMLLLA